MEAQKCSICREIPEDILMLSCSHDICLVCASSRLITRKQQHVLTNNQNIRCDICGILEEIDQQTLAQLRKFSQQTYSQMLSKEQDCSFKFPNSQNLNFRPKSYCMDHTQQQLLYFCFDCVCQCICPECVIHGKHKEHQVKTIKRSVPIIKRKLQDTLRGLEEKASSIQKLKEQLQNKIGEIEKENKCAKDMLQQIFNVRLLQQDIKNKVSLKEKEIMGKCDKILEMALEEADQKKRILQLSIQEIRDKTAEIRHCFSKEEIEFLNQFATKKNIFEISDKQITFQTQIDRVKISKECLIKLSQIGNIIMKIDFSKIISESKISKKNQCLEEYSQNKTPFLNN